MRQFILNCAKILFCCFLLTEGVPTEWVDITSVPSAYSYVDATWPQAGVVVAAGNQVNGGSIVRSSDYGVTWTQEAANYTFGNLYSVTSSTLANGDTYVLAVADNGGVYSSKDIGTTWYLNQTEAVALYGVSIGSNGQAYACGDIYKVYVATLPGSSWSVASFSSSLKGGQFFDISTIDGVNVIAVGSKGYIYYTLNSGTSWTKYTNSITTIIYTVAHGSSLTAMAAGASSYVAKTTDGGVTWQTLSVFTSNSITIRFHSISFVSTTEIYIVGSNGEIRATYDGGTSWSIVASTNAVLYSISMYDSIKGVAGGVAGSGIFTLVPGMYFIVL